MKFLISLSAIFFQLVLAPAQSLELEVMASSGEIFSIPGGPNLHWSLGEVVTERFENEKVLTQGFHQIFEVVTSVNENPGYQIHLKVFPNPVAHQLTIESESTTPLKAVIQDIFGRRIFEQHLIGIKDQLKLPEVPAGTYMLSIYHETGLIQIFKLQKIGI